MSVAICSSVGLCLERANTGWISEGARFNAAGNAVANNTSAATFARRMTPRRTGSGPRICASRLSSDSASHTDTATRAITVIDHAAYSNSIRNTCNAVWLGRGLTVQMSQRQQRRDEQAAHDDGCTGLGEDLGAVGIRRDQIVLDEPPQEQAGQIAIRRQRSPHRRCPAPSAPDPGAARGARRPVPASCSPGPCAGARPSRPRPRAPREGR